MKYEDYQPNPAVLETLCHVDLAAVIGPTAVGKTMLMNAAEERDPSARLVLTTTSREPRPGEQDGVDFHFRPETDMLERIRRREFVQVAPNVFGPLYATLPEDYTASGTALMAIIVDALPAFQKLPFKRLRQLFILPPSWEAWQERMASHGFDKAALQKRLTEAKTSLQYAAGQPDLLFVLNDEREQAIRDFMAILKDEPPRISLQEGRNRAQVLLSRL